MAILWLGDELTAKVQKAENAAVNATMSAAILHAKEGHGPGAHAAQRFVTHTGEAERSIRIVAPARREGRGAVGRWGSIGINYFRRLELGFQGQDSLGRVYDQPAFPSLVPAKDAEYPNLAKRIKAALARGRA